MTFVQVICGPVVSWSTVRASCKLVSGDGADDDDGDGVWFCGRPPSLSEVWT